ncbi:MAG: HDIG domain-containing metalloprotein [Bacteroidota bacterium]
MTREDALELLHEYTKTDSLRKHALAVEAVTRAYARKNGENEEEWGNVGLLHDFDYEMYPNVPDHPMKGSEILAERGFPEHLRKAILGHVPALGVPRDTLLAKTLFACDELSGFVVACALVRPTKLSDLTASSVKKKLKDKAFARTVSREDIQLGMEELQMNPDEHIQFVIESLKPISKELGL